MISPRSLTALPLLAAALLAAVPGLASAQEPSRPPTRQSAPVTAGAPSKLPPFLKVDGMYTFDGNDEDLIKVTELSPETGWVRVETKGGESWINVANLTTITPVSKELAAKTELKAKADFILDNLQTIQQAINDYASSNNLPPTAPYTWKDIRKFIRPETTAYNSGGNDVTGRPYDFGTKISDGVKVSPDTIKELAPVIDDPDGYWGKFKH